MYVAWFCFMLYVYVDSERPYKSSRHGGIQHMLARFRDMVCVCVCVSTYGFTISFHELISWIESTYVGMVLLHGVCIREFKLMSWIDSAYVGMVLLHGCVHVD